MALAYAHEHDNVDAVKKLLADERMPAVNLQALFHFACGHNCMELVKKLLINNCVDPTNYYSCGLRIACAQKSTGVVQVLLEDGRADPLELDDRIIDAVLGHPVQALLSADDRVHDRAVARTLPTVYDYPCGTGFAK